MRQHSAEIAASRCAAMRYCRKQFALNTFVSNGDYEWTGLHRRCSARMCARRRLQATVTSPGDGGASERLSHV